jgi:ubiquinone/menaquinone biosynthesis C-methylase UbiE
MSDPGANRKPRTIWPRSSRESAVERFYSHGVNGETDIHRGFLNFGLWERSTGDYVAAAENLVRRLGTMLGLGAGARLLDVACGMGSQDVHLQRAFGPLEIDGLDVTWQHVERATRRARDEALADRLRFHHGTATALPFSAGTFTHLMSIEGPEHFDTRRGFFEEAIRVLRPGGVMCLADYTVNARPRNVVERTIFGAVLRMWKVPRENVWNAAEYHEQLQATGFRDVSLDHVGALTFPGYYREQCRPAFRAEMRRLQGPVVERLGHLIDVVTNRAYEMGLIDYVLVRAVKPALG